MPRRYEDYRNEEAGRASGDFDTVNPRVLSTLQDRPEEAAALAGTLEARRNARKAIQEEQEKSRSVRVADKVIEVYEETSSPQPPRLDAHFGGAGAVREVSMREEAARRVDREDAARLEEFDTQTRAIIDKATVQHEHAEQKDGTVQSDANSQSLQVQRFKAEIHQVAERAWRARDQAHRIFRNDRERLLEEARKSGAENPAREVATAQRNVIEAIRKQEHSEFHEVFQRHGWDRSQQNVMFYPDGHLNTAAFENAVDGIQAEQSTQQSYEATLDMDDDQTS